MKKETMVKAVENTYETVGAAEAIENCTGMSDNKSEAEYIGYIVKHLFDKNEVQERKTQALLVEYYEKQPDDFFKDIDPENLVTRMAEDLVDIESAELSEQYGFRNLNNDNTYSANDWSTKLNQAQLINKIKEMFPVLRKKMDKASFKKLVDWCKAFRYEDWDNGITKLHSMIFDMKRGYLPEECLSYAMKSMVITGR